MNHAERRASPSTVELELGADGADIFEVRGYPRPERGRLLPVAVADRRITFRYDGLDEVQRLTHLAFSESWQDARAGRRDPARELPTPGPRCACAGPSRWDPARSASCLDDLADAPGPRRRPSATRPRPRRGGGPLPRPAAGSRGTRATAAYHAWEQRHDQGRQRPRAVQPRRQAVGLATCACSSTTGPGRPSATSPPACPGSRRCSGGTRSSRAFQALAFRPQLAVETLEVLAAYQATEIDDLARRRAGQDPARAADRRDGRRRRAAAHALLRLGRLDAAVADPARRDVRLDRRPRPRRPAVAERAGRARLDRPTTATATATGSSSTSAARSAGS